MRALSTLLFIGFFVTATFAISEQVLYTFSSPGPVAPYGGLIPDGSGNFYGTTVDGGLYEFGAVYEISPSAGGWVETTLYSFSGGSDGGNPTAGLTRDLAGNYYGVASIGGNFTNCSVGCGIVFELTPDGSG